MKKPSLLLIFALAFLLLLVWIGYRTYQGPLLEAYQVNTQTLVQTVVATGRVAALSRIQVGSPLTAVVLQRHVMEGDQVAPGDLLLSLRADDLTATLQEAEAALAQLRQSSRPQAQAALREAQARLAQASREVIRRQTLLAQQLIAPEALEQAQQQEIIARSALEQAQLLADTFAAGQPGEAALIARVANAKAQLAKTEIRAEVAGTILSRNAEPGDLVQPGRVLFEIARSNSTELLVPVDEKNLGVLAIGQRATGIADAFPAEPFNAELIFIAPGIDPQRGTVDVRLRVEPIPAFLREGMTISVNIETARREQALVVANDALQQLSGNQAEVWLVTDNKVSRHQVRLGLRGLTQTEIVAGLNSGDQILADARAAVSDGQRVRLTQANDSVAASSSRNELPARLD